MANEVKQEKERKGIAAWWAGLKKGAKIGITAGGVAILAGATVGIVFGVKSCSGGGIGETITLTSDGGSGYESKDFNIKSNYKYTFKLTLGTTNAASFFIRNSSSTGHIKFKDAKLEGVQNNWAIDSDGERFGGNPISEQGAQLTITITSLENGDNVKAQVDKGGE